MALNRSDVVAGIAEHAGLTKAQADAALAGLQHVLEAALRGDTPVRIAGLLAVERSHRAARVGRNPRTGEALDIPAGTSAKITAGSALKEAAKA
ncbi:HU family DNA-binding protein [Actinotalea subterranea]|uniref:HU family DNA-binding protein n=1 Tax=Actinotalea subterranea TaxID=2607497 RepID=UPI0011F02F8C